MFASIYLISCVLPTTSLDSSVSIVTTLRSGRSGVRIHQGKYVFPFSKTSRQTVGPTLPPGHWVLGHLSLEAKQPERKVDHFHLVRKL